MKVTKIVPQKNAEARNIYIDGEFSFSASLEDIFKYSINEGMEIDSSELASLTEACEYSKAYNYGLWLLGGKDYTSEEIRKKLKQRSFSEATIIKVINKLKEYNLINDGEYIEKYKNDCTKIKKYGINKIKNNLLVKGVSKEAVNTIEINEDEQYGLCMEAALKKERILGDCRNKRDKLFRFLINRGFEYETVMKVINSRREYNDENSMEYNE